MEKVGIERKTLSVKELSVMLGISENVVYQYLNEGLIPAWKLRKKWVISRDRVLQWLADSPAVPMGQREKCTR